MRKLSDAFMKELKEGGFLSPITSRVQRDRDLNLEIRDGYINVYFKGNSLLKLSQLPKGYKLEVHEKFKEGLTLPGYLLSKKDTDEVIKSLPVLKDNIAMIGTKSLEIEYEQMIIRANNFEPRNNSEYFIIDRQYAVNDKANDDEDKRRRFDLTGIFWDRTGRNKKQDVDLCLMEVKFALNHDISEIDEQLSEYYEILKPRATEFASELQAVFQQKLDLGLYRQTTPRLEAMKKLRISEDFSRFQFVVVLVDYNPNSRKLNSNGLKKLHFTNQIKIFRAGLAMWKQQVKPLSMDT